MIQSVCVYCSSSNRSSPVYLEAAARLGRTLAENGITIVYGGGSLGSMGRVAGAALDAGGKVIGVLPRFMDEKHRAMWSVAGDPGDVIAALESAGEWSRNARDFAALL